MLDAVERGVGRARAGAAARAGAVARSFMFRGFAV
jgi:hypothetical protein